MNSTSVCILLNTSTRLINSFYCSDDFFLCSFLLMSEYVYFSSPLNHITFRYHRDYNTVNYNIENNSI